MREARLLEAMRQRRHGLPVIAQRCNRHAGERHMQLRQIWQDWARH